MSTTNGKGHPSGRKKTILDVKLDKQKTKKWWHMGKKEFILLIISNLFKTITFKPKPTY